MIELPPRPAAGLATCVVVVVVVDGMLLVGLAVLDAGATVALEQLARTSTMGANEEVIAASATRE